MTPGHPCPKGSRDHPQVPTTHYYYANQAGSVAQQPGYVIQQPGCGVQQSGYVVQQPGCIVQQPSVLMQGAGAPVMVSQPVVVGVAAQPGIAMAPVQQLTVEKLGCKVMSD